MKQHQPMKLHQKNINKLQCDAGKILGT
jgi:hypothetical protein